MDNRSSKINSFIEELSLKLWEYAATNLEAIMLTGSFASWLNNNQQHQPSWAALPDVNFYPLVLGDESCIIEVERSLMNSIHATVEEFKAEGVKFSILLDLHPFSISPYEFNHAEDKICLQLTTRVINLGMPENYPPYCWHGWLSNNLLLKTKTPNILEKVKYRDKLQQDEEWFRNVYLALVSYGNIVHMLPLYSFNKLHLFDEAFRYAKEVTKDGLSVTLSSEEYAEGKTFELLHGWKNESIEFYKKRYGESASEIVSEIVYIDDNYLESRKEKDPFELIESVLTLRKIVFAKFHEKAIRFQPELGKIFKEMPLWW